MKKLSIHPASDNIRKNFNVSQEVIDFVIPPYVYWSFNNEWFSSITNNETDKFDFEYRIDNNVMIIPIKIAVKNALKRIISLSNNKKIAVCIGGADSEIIARELKSLDYPFELFFLNIVNLNNRAQSVAESIADELKVPINIVYLDKNTLISDVVPRMFNLLQAEKPTYLCLPYLFENIPDEFVILGGEGDPQKSGIDYEVFATSDGKFDGIPISSTEIFYRQWALANNRMCNMYFYATTAELIKSYFYHPDLQNDNFSISTRELVDNAWPNLKFKEKTTNWETFPDANLKLRLFARSLNNNNFKSRPSITIAKI
jgi:hypothetical protein